MGDHFIKSEMLNRCLAAVIVVERHLSAPRESHSTIPLCLTDTFCGFNLVTVVSPLLICPKTRPDRQGTGNGHGRRATGQQQCCCQNSQKKISAHDAPPFSK
jgi:hypothetical protein